MIEIDGAAGEGGGRILRRSLSLSALTGKPFGIRNIRARRSKPGLMRQHLTAARTATEICGAGVDGAEVGTHNSGAPSFDFLDRSFLPLLGRMGYAVSARIKRPGFYPAVAASSRSPRAPAAPSGPKICPNRCSLARASAGLMA
jgi:RNA 3'-terminal phosphate cyclase (ATP)